MKEDKMLEERLREIVEIEALRYHLERDICLEEKELIVIRFFVGLAFLCFSWFYMEGMQLILPALYRIMISLNLNPLISLGLISAIYVAITIIVYKAILEIKSLKSLLKKVFGIRGVEYGYRKSL